MNSLLKPALAMTTQQTLVIRESVGCIAMKSVEIFLIRFLSISGQHAGLRYNNRSLPANYVIKVCRLNWC